MVNLLSDQATYPHGVAGEDDSAANVGKDHAPISVDEEL